MEITIYVVLFFVTSFFHGLHSTIFTIKNNCPYTIWPATLTSLGSASSSGFELIPHASFDVTVSTIWSGRIWARYVCSNVGGNFTCRTGDCGSGKIECNGAGGIPPYTLVEVTLAGADRKDFYDVSLVDGFNLPVKVIPQGVGCSITSCPVDINNHGCPRDLAVLNADGGIIGCKSACVAFNEPQYCCTGAYSTPDTCKPTNYSLIFKQLCPQAYSYAYDDKTSTFTCSTGPNYVIEFCP